MYIRTRFCGGSRRSGRIFRNCQNTERVRRYRANKEGRAAAPINEYVCVCKTALSFKRSSLYVRPLSRGSRRFRYRAAISSGSFRCLRALSCGFLSLSLCDDDFPGGFLIFFCQEVELFTKSSRDTASFRPGARREAIYSNFYTRQTFESKAYIDQEFYSRENNGWKGLEETTVRKKELEKTHSRSREKRRTAMEQGQAEK